QVDGGAKAGEIGQPSAPDGNDEPVALHAARGEHVAHLLHPSEDLRRLADRPRDGRAQPRRLMREQRLAPRGGEEPRIAENCSRSPEADRGAQLVEMLERVRAEDAASSRTRAEFDLELTARHAAPPGSAPPPR